MATLCFDRQSVSATFVRLRLITLFLLFFLPLSNHAVAEDSVSGFYYSPAISGGCYANSRVVQIADNDIFLFENNQRIPWISEIKIQRNGATFKLEGKPVGNALVSRAFNSLSLDYKIVDQELIPTSAKFDDIAMDTNDPIIAQALEKFTLQSCSSPTFIANLAMSIGIYAEFEQPK